MASKTQRRLVARESSNTVAIQNGFKSITSSTAQTKTVQHSNLTPSSIAVWLSSARTPYEKLEERKGLQTWLEIMRHMGRSDVGLKVWTVLVPMMAWSFDAVRHVQTATALVLDSHRRRDDASQYGSVESLSLQHAKMAVEAALNPDLPTEVQIMVSIILWMFEMMIGRCKPANNHAATAYRLASQADLNRCAEPIIAKYVKSFVSELRQMFNEIATEDLPEPEQEEFIDERTRYSRDIMLHAKHSIKFLRHKLTTELRSRLPTYSYTRALLLLDSSEKGLDNVLEGWHRKAVFDCTEEDIHYTKAIERYSPFGRLFRYFHNFFEDHDESHLTKFHLEFRPCLDYFMWVAAGTDLEARQAVMPLWNVQWAISPRASIIAAT